MKRTKEQLRAMREKYHIGEYANKKTQYAKHKHNERDGSR